MVWKVILWCTKNWKKKKNYFSEKKKKKKNIIFEKTPCEKCQKSKMVKKW